MSQRLPSGPERDHAGVLAPSTVLPQPLFSHELIGGDDQPRIVTRPVLSSLTESGGPVAVAVTPVAGIEEAKAFVTAFDKALLRYGSRRDIATGIGFAKGSAGDAVMVDRDTLGRRGEVTDATTTCRIQEVESALYGLESPGVGLRHNIVIGSNGASDVRTDYSSSDFSRIGQLAAWAAADHLAYQVEQAAPDRALPSREAAMMLNRFIARERPDETIEPVQSAANTTTLDFGKARINVTLPHGAPDQRRWSVETPNPMASHPDQPSHIEVASGPITFESLNQGLTHLSQAIRSDMSAAKQPMITDLVGATVQASARDILAARNAQLSVTARAHGHERPAVDRTRRASMTA